jgi:mannose-6-phosphate isomerase-like protein (cupin superfamily)
MAFEPNRVSFEQGLERIRAATRKAGMDPARTILTSRDKAVRHAQQLLTVTEVPGGFTKWQLPVHLQEPAQLFITVAAPNAEAAEHSHDEGDGIRFIASGSIFYRDVELTAGDWMFVPAGAKYSFRTGPFGALMCYCYCCCCAGTVALFDPAGPVEMKA